MRDKQKSFFLTELEDLLGSDLFDVGGTWHYEHREHQQIDPISCYYVISLIGAERNGWDIKDRRVFFSAVFTFNSMDNVAMP